MMNEQVTTSGIDEVRYPFGSMKVYWCHRCRKKSILSFFKPPVFCMGCAAVMDGE